MKTYTIKELTRTFVELENFLSLCKNYGLDIVQSGVVILLIAYSKNEQDNLSAAEKAQLKVLVDQLKQRYGRDING